MKPLSTDPNVLSALSRAARRRVSAEEVQRQKIDYIVTALGKSEAITRERVEHELNKLAGEAA